MSSDDFSRAPENPLAAPWTTWFGSGLKIATNGYCQIVNATNQDTGAYYSSSAEPYSEIVVNATPTEQYMGPSIHCGAGTGYTFYCHGGTARLVKATGGVLSTIATNSSGIPTITAGSVMRIWRSAGTIHCSVDGSELTPLQSSDSSYTSGSPGIYILNNDNSVTSWNDGAGGGSVNLAGGATAGAAGAAGITVTKQLAAGAVAGALASGGLSVHKPLTGAAIAQAVGSAVLQAFATVWRIPTNAPNGTAVHVMVLNGASPTYGIIAQGPATVAGGYVDLPGSGSAGTKAFAYVSNYNDNTAVASIRGGPSIATLTSL